MIPLWVEPCYHYITLCTFHYITTKHAPNNAVPLHCSSAVICYTLLTMLQSASGSWWCSLHTFAEIDPITFHIELMCLLFILCISNVNSPLSSLGPIFILISLNLLFYLRLLCFSDFILIQGDIFGRAGISSVLPLRSIFCQKCHQRLFRQSSRHGFQQRLFQKRRPA